MNSAESLFYSGEFYDNYYAAQLHTDRDFDLGGDLEFWCEIARKYGDPILELGCGTGRITFPLAKAGYRVVGLDPMPTMLDRAKARSVELGYSEKIELLAADASNFNLERTFPLILGAGEVLEFFHRWEDIQTALNCVRQHLATEGYFVFDVRHPSPKFFQKLLTSDGTPQLDRVFPNPQGGQVIATFVQKYDYPSQIYTERFLFYLGDCAPRTGRANRPEPIIEEYHYRTYFPQEIETLLQVTGFQVIERFGDYDRSPFSAESPRQIIVCQKKETGNS